MQTLQGSDSSLLLKSEIFENLSLHLEDVEFLHNAFLVQPLVAPLVRFSNRGRYESYVAKSWTHEGNSWKFQIHSGLTCEDGELINAESFKESLARSLQRSSLEEIKQMPFGDLVGIESFLEKNDRSNLGIVASDKELIFHFKKKVGKSLLEYLAMSPFSFICKGNFESSNSGTFISSGPYRVIRFDPKANLCVLEKRSEWPLNSKNSFKTVYLSKNDLPDVQPTAAIHMTYAIPKASLPSTDLVLEVPRALLSVRLGVEESQFFSDRKKRQTLQKVLRRILLKQPVLFENYHRAEGFFFGQVTGHEIEASGITPVSPPTSPLKVRALERGTRPETDFYQDILFSALDELEWPYEIIKKPVSSIQDYYNRSYDMAFDRSHVDATLDVDFLKLLFKSNLGPKYQDPGGRVSDLIDRYENHQVSYRDFLIEFNSIISEEAAVLPLYHRGFSWKFSSNIETLSISPLMSILRYEELNLNTQIKD